ncbi:MAG TPA: DUF4337 domain-containing protein [Thermoanaerobaculia bacterium]|nr:DUF4337 domain-containing protein [Thermoanaerobaculia bacterium]
MPETVAGPESPDTSRLNTVVAALVALLATVMAVGNIKDGNIVQAMQQAQSNRVDTWSYYQAKSTKGHLAESIRDQLQLQRELNPGANPEARALLDKKIAFYQAQVAKYEKEKAEIQGKAKGYEAEYDRLNVHDDQFDMAEAGLNVAIALLGISALTRKWWLVWIAVAFASFGVLMDAAGFLGWALHPNMLAKWLS